MLCPDCKTAAPGGQLCPQCGHTVPERESFSGQGGRYLLVLCALALVQFSAILLIRTFGPGSGPEVPPFGPGVNWLYIAVVGAPLAVAIYYWYVLREEEITVTDQAIRRRSHWGDEQLLWADVRAFRRRAFPLRQTRLGRLTWFSRFFPRGRPEPHPPSRWSGAVYELVGPSDGDSPAQVMRLEPGTIEDLAWLLELIQEHIGPPQDT